MKRYGDIDSKFRFVILASQRAKQLLRGAKPKIKSKSKNLIRIAQNEVSKGLIDYVFVQPKTVEVSQEEDEIFIGEDLKENLDMEAGEADKEEEEAPESQEREAEGEETEDAEEEDLEEQEERETEDEKIEEEPDEEKE